VENFRIHYSGACFESGGSREQVENKVHDRIASLGEILEIEAIPVHPCERDCTEENYVVSFEGEITVQAEEQVKAENQAYDRLSDLGQITVVALEKVGE